MAYRQDDLVLEMVEVLFELAKTHTYIQIQIQIQMVYYFLLAPLKQKYNTIQSAHRTTVKMLIGQVIEESHAL